MIYRAGNEVYRKIWLSKTKLKPSILHSVGKCKYKYWLTTCLRSCDMNVIVDAANPWSVPAIHGKFASVNNFYTYFLSKESSELLNKLCFVTRYFIFRYFSLYLLIICFNWDSTVQSTKQEFVPNSNVKNIYNDILYQMSHRQVTANYCACMQHYKTLYVCRCLVRCVDTSSNSRVLLQKL